MTPLSEVIKEAENVAGDLLQSLPDIGAIVKKIDPHATAVDKIVELVPRLEAAVQEIEKIAGITPALPEPPAPGAAPAPVEKPATKPIEISAPGQPEAEAETHPAAEETSDEVTIKVTPEQAAQLGKTPIQISTPGA